MASLFLEDAERGRLARAGQIVDGGRHSGPLDDTELGRLELDEDEDGRPGEDRIAGQARRFQWAMDEDHIPDTDTSDEETAPDEELQELVTLAADRKRKKKRKKIIAGNKKRAVDE